MNQLSDWNVVLTEVACSHSAKPSIGAYPFGAGRVPLPMSVLPSTESQCLPAAGGFFSGHLNIGEPWTRAPAWPPLRSGCRPTLKIVPAGKPFTDTPSAAAWAEPPISTAHRIGLLSAS